jgi:hypothetical protein
MALLFIVAQTPSPTDWGRFVLIIVGLAAAIVALRLIFKVSRWILLLGVLAVMSILVVRWVENRREPAFLTPFIELIVHALPERRQAGEK